MNRSEHSKRWWEKLKKERPWAAFLAYARSRCNKKNKQLSYANIKCVLTLPQIKQLWERDDAYMLKRPSLDRIDSKLNYTYENCRFIEWRENVCCKHKNYAPRPYKPSWNSGMKFSGSLTKRSEAIALEDK